MGEHRSGSGDGWLERSRLEKKNERRRTGTYFHHVLTDPGCTQLPSDTLQAVARDP